MPRRRTSANNRNSNSDGLRQRMKSRDVSPVGRAAAPDAAADADVVRLPTPQSSPKSLVVAYLMWLCGGLFGWHHFYLKRDLQATIYACTFGGFGFGYVLDFFRMPNYVEDADEGSDYSRVLAFKMMVYKTPPHSAFNFISICFFSGVLATIGLNIQDAETTPPFVLAFLSCVGAAIGAYYASRIDDRQSGKFRHTLAGAVAGGMMIYFGEATERGSTAFAAMLGASITCTFTRHWITMDQSPRRTRGGCCKRFFKIVAVVALIWTATCVSAYHNMEVTVDDGEPIRLKDYASTFFESKAWKEFANAIDEITRIGWRNFFAEIFKQMELFGEEKALAKMGLSKGATWRQIKRQWRKMALKYHPDHNKDPNAAKEFNEIRQAFESLTKIHKRRRTNSDEPPDAKPQRKARGRSAA